MDRIELEKYFSKDRLKRYFDFYPGNEDKAIYLYEANIAISEALYTSLSLLEVSLRNKINEELARKYGRIDWYAEWCYHKTMRFAWPEVNNAIRHLHENKKQIAPDKIIAELMFGFWTSLFNDRYEKELWSNLRFVFPHMPKSIRQRKNISSPLNDIRRSLRNRIYHNEPIIFNTTILYKHYSNVVQLLDWMGADLASYNKTKDRFPEVFNKMTMQLKTL